MFQYAHKGDIRSILYESSKGNSLKVNDEAGSMSLSSPPFSHFLLLFLTSPSFSNKRKGTLLHWAVDGGHLEVVKQLVTNHALDVNSKDENGNTS